MPLHTEFGSIQALHEALAARRVSARELAQSALDAAGARADLNAFLHVDDKLTLAQADSADKLLEQGRGTVLTGIPLPHKAVFATQGWRTHEASKMLADNTRPVDAHVGARLLRAGAATKGNGRAEGGGKV